MILVLVLFCLDWNENDFILKVSFQLRFLNFRVKVYFAYRDLSPHRPFQELTQIYTKQSTTSTKETFTFWNIFSQFGFKNAKSSAQVDAPPPQIACSPPSSLSSACNECVFNNISGNSQILIYQFHLERGYTTPFHNIFTVLGRVAIFAFKPSPGKRFSIS